MVNVIYGEHSQQVELAGKTVADVREMFESEFDLSDRAQANLNGQWLKKNLEAETGLYDDDELYFEERSRRGLVMLGAFLLTLAVTGALFAYTYTTKTTTLDVTSGEEDFASVSANTTISYTVLGRTRGTIGAGTLFNVPVSGNYTGDLEVQVALANVDQLSQDYSSWSIRLELQNAAGAHLDIQGDPQLLSLDNPNVSFYSGNLSSAGPGYVKCVGGTYRALPFNWLTPYDPLLFVQVVQADVQ